MLGWTGVGISATANAITGNPRDFNECAGAYADSHGIRARLCRWYGPNGGDENPTVIVIDTPGFGNPAVSDEENLAYIQSMLCTLGRINKFIYCFNSVDARLDENKTKIISSLEAAIGSEHFFRHLILCGTHYNYSE